MAGLSLVGCKCPESRHDATHVASRRLSDVAGQVAGTDDKCDPTTRRGCPDPFVAQAFTAVVTFSALAALSSGGIEPSRPPHTLPGDGKGEF